MESLAKQNLLIKQLRFLQSLRILIIWTRIQTLYENHLLINEKTRLRNSYRYQTILFCFLKKNSLYIIAFILKQILRVENNFLWRFYLENILKLLAFEKNHNKFIGSKKAKCLISQKDLNRLTIRKLYLGQHQKFEKAYKNTATRIGLLNWVKMSRHEG